MDLAKELEANAADELRQMLAVVKYSLSPLTGGGVVLSKREYSDEILKASLRCEFLGIGTQYTWHGAPDCDCRCDVVDIVNLDLHIEDGELSVTELSGAKTLIEMKPSTLGPRYLHQFLGNVVTYSFVHHHPHQNALVPVVGISGGQGTFVIGFYDPVRPRLHSHFECDCLLYHYCSLSCMNVSYWPT